MGIEEDNIDTGETMGSNIKAGDEVVRMESCREIKVVKTRLAFAIDERPPLHLAAFYGFQIIMSNLPGTVTAVFIVHNAVCGGTDYQFLAKLMSSSIFMSGFASLLQVLLGVRYKSWQHIKGILSHGTSILPYLFKLPITQGSSFTFFPPLIALMASERWKCPVDLSLHTSNGTFSSVSNFSTMPMETEQAWKPRIALVSGGLIAASFVQVLMGITGAVGFLMNYIGPITLAPTVMLIGLSLFPVAIDAAKHQWGIAFLTIALIVVFTTVLGDVKVPIISWNKKEGLHIARYPIIRMFSNFLAIGIAWLLCYILTITGRLPTDKDAIGYYARTDAKLDSMKKVQWFYIPHPGQFGLPTFGPDIFVGMLAATIGSILESIADYHATAKICEIPKPPKHAINRGIAMEGLASVISGLYGTCHGTTSYSNVIGFIAYSGVASRWPWVFMSVAMMTMAIFGKVAGALAALPDPVLGGLVTLGLGLVILVGISQLHAVDLMATRNQIAIGLSLMLGMMLPKFISDDPSVINTGSDDVDSVINVFLSTAPFVGGIVGFIIDNILPGTHSERGMAPREPDSEEHEMLRDRFQTIFNFPFPTGYLKNIKCFSYIPSLPCYKERRIPCASKKNSIFCKKVNHRNNNGNKSNTRSDTDCIVIETPSSHITSL